MNDNELERWINNADWHWETAAISWVIATVAFLAIVLGVCLGVRFFFG